MQRRALLIVPAACAGLALASWARAAALSEGDAASGIRAALERGAAVAIDGLGRKDGFLGNAAVRIELPGYLKDGANLLKMTGQGKQVDELVTAMNRAAEAAVPAAKPLLLAAIKSMSVEDGLRILQGGDDAATQFFAGKTREPLAQKFLPIVTQATDRVALADKYNAVAGKAAGLGLIRGQDANIQQYVTGRALDGLFLMIAEEERKIRKDPVGTGSALLKKVFG
ncbi:hypothetical protein HNP55_001744 [Paucibacter oligotrophus]|uniref:DUF4197 domain-containing protein n=1 Tax=Roseateles oligotrophus TaxID=1769250 RepID=A0A840L8Z3_9BURK|nr:DUF4197 domain-containing protein [Roseateles oligotrophus]MBB4843225.1 hypothetical protein [Roseateles oligotrophus]